MTVEVPRHEALAEQFRKVHLGLDSAPAVIAALNRPGFAGDQIVPITRPYRVWSGLHETRLLCFSGWDVADGFKQGEWVNATGSSEPTNVVEPVDPFEGFQFHLLHSFPRAAPANDLGFVKANDRFGQGIVICITNTPD